MSFICVSFMYGQTHANILGVFQNNNVKYFTLSDIDSICHQNEYVCVYSVGEHETYEISDVDSVVFMHKEDNEFYRMDKNCLDSWDDGCMNSNGDFLLVKYDNAKNEYFAFLGQTKKLEEGCVLIFDDSYNIKYMYNKNGSMSVIPDNTALKKYACYIYNTDSVVVKEITDSPRLNKQNYKMLPGDALSVIFNWYGNASLYGDIAKLLQNSGNYKQFIHASLLLGISQICGFGFSIGLDYLNKKYKEQYEYLLQQCMGTANTWISNIDDTKAPNYKLDVTVNSFTSDGLHNDNLPMTLSLNAGTAVKLNDSGVSFDNCDYKLNEHGINAAETYNVNIYAVDDVDYYVRPYVVVMLNGIEQTLLTRPENLLWGARDIPYIRYGDTEKISYILSPVAYTGEVSDITDVSATIKCSYSDIPNDAICGVEYIWSNGSGQQIIGGDSGEKPIPLGGLKPNTEYTCTAFVIYKGITYKAKNSTTFKTLPADISGTWSCVETYYIHGNYSNPQYRIYTINLRKDGKAEVDNGEDYSKWEAFDGWSWQLHGNKLQMECTLIANQSQYSGYKINGTVDNLDDPKKISGRRFNWNVNQNGSFENDGWEIVMTR